MMRSCWTVTPLVWLGVVEWLESLLMSVWMVLRGGHMGLILNKFLNKALSTKA